MMGFLVWSRCLNRSRRTGIRMYCCVSHASRVLAASGRSADVGVDSCWSGLLRKIRDSDDKRPLLASKLAGVSGLDPAGVSGRDDSGVSGRDPAGVFRTWPCGHFRTWLCCPPPPIVAFLGASKVKMSQLILIIRNGRIGVRNSFKTWPVRPKRADLAAIVSFQKAI